MLRIVCLLLTLVVTPLASARDISGFWKHADEPGWIEIQLDAGKGVVVRNDKFPERVGREILKDLRADGSGESLWRGQVYAEKLGEYKEAKITLPEPEHMVIEVKVGFISRSVQWVRVDEVPVEDVP